MHKYYRYAQQGNGLVCANCAGNPPPVQPRQNGAQDRDSASTCCLCDNQPISLAMAYVKEQPFDVLYEPCEGWKAGTLFPDLYMPYCIGGKTR